MASSIVWHKSRRAFIILIYQRVLCLNKKLSVNKQMKQECFVTPQQPNNLFTGLFEFPQQYHKN